MVIESSDECTRTNWGTAVDTTPSPLPLLPPSEASAWRRAGVTRYVKPLRTLAKRRFPIPPRNLLRRLQKRTEPQMFGTRHACHPLPDTNVTRMARGEHTSVYTPAASVTAAARRKASTRARLCEGPRGDIAQASVCPSCPQHGFGKRTLRNFMVTAMAANNVDSRMMGRYM